MAALVAFTAFAVYYQPAVRAQRLSPSLWARCWLEESTPELKDRLALDHYIFAPDWTDLDHVADYLRRHEVRDGELTCYSISTTFLYLDVGVTPSTRYIYASIQRRNFPSHRDAIQEAIKSSGHRYLVTDMRELGLKSDEAAAESPDKPLAYPPQLSPKQVGEYPLTEPVVFRAGRYFVHQARGWTGATCSPRAP